VNIACFGKTKALGRTCRHYSIPVFFGPNADAIIEVVPTCQGPLNPPRYEPITYRDSRKWYYGE